MHNHYMFDIETKGLKPGSHITSVAVVQFDPFDFGLKRIEVVVNNRLTGQKVTRRSDPNTLRWREENNVDEREAELEVLNINYLFELLYQKMDVGVNYAWAKSPSFDLTHLLLQPNSKSPWGYRQEMDVRTIEYILHSKGEKFEEAFTKEVDRIILKNTPPHTALGDCFRQILTVQYFFSLFNPEEYY